MPLRIRLITALAAAAISAPVPAAASETASQSARDREDNKVVCKGETKINSRLKDLVCKTRAQWEEMRVQQQRDAKEMVDRPKICGGGGSQEGC